MVQEGTDRSTLSEQKVVRCRFSAVFDTHKKGPAMMTGPIKGDLTLESVSIIRSQQVVYQFSGSFPHRCRVETAQLGFPTVRAPGALNQPD